MFRSVLERRFIVGAWDDVHYIGGPESGAGLVDRWRRKWFFFVLFFFFSSIVEKSEAVN